MNRETQRALERMMFRRTMQYDRVRKPLVCSCLGMFDRTSKEMGVRDETCRMFCSPSHCPSTSKTSRTLIITYSPVSYHPVSVQFYNVRQEIETWLYEKLDVVEKAYGYENMSKEDAEQRYKDVIVRQKKCL